MQLPSELLTHINSSLSKPRHREWIESVGAKDVHLRCQKPTTELFFFILVVTYFTISSCSWRQKSLSFILLLNSCITLGNSLISLNDFLPIKWDADNNKYLLWFAFIVPFCLPQWKLSQGRDFYLFCSLINPRIWTSFSEHSKCSVNICQLNESGRRNLFSLELKMSLGYF